MFGLNRAEVIGRLGADVTVNHLVSGGRVANLSIATDESYLDRNSGNKEERTEWHRVVSFQPGLILNGPSGSPRVGPLLMHGIHDPSPACRSAHPRRNLR